MSDINVKIDTSSLAQYLENFAVSVTKTIEKEIAGLAKDAMEHIKEKAQTELHSFRDKYIESLTVVQVSDTMWEVILSADASWIEEGSPEPFDMKPGLLKGGKTSKDGTKYRVVPMNQNPLPNTMRSGRDTGSTKDNIRDKKGNYIGAGFENNLKKQVQAHLKKLGISSHMYNKLEIDPRTGSPRVGKITSFDLPGDAPGKGNTGILARVNVYQREVEMMNKKSKKMEKVVQRQVTTFRTVTDSDDQKDKWIHPPVKALHFFDECKVWAEKEWETVILPKIVQKYQGR